MQRTGFTNDTNRGRATSQQVLQTMNWIILSANNAIQISGAENLSRHLHAPLRVAEWPSGGEKHSCLRLPTA
jgi:hypothetical protein